MNSSTAALGSIAGFAPAYDFDDWRSRAACRGVDIDIFFPPAGKANVATYEKARSYCNRCDVLVECLQDAIATGAFDGFRAGSTGFSREKARRGQRGRSSKVAVRSVRDEAEVIEIRDGLRGVLAELRSGL